MTKEITFNVPPWKFGEDNTVHELFTMKRGIQRRMSHPNIVIETLRALDDQRPTRDQLQKFSKIRRRRFIAVLKDLLETGSVSRTGSGTKFDPFLYELGEKERRR